MASDICILLLPCTAALDFMRRGFSGLKSATNAWPVTLAIFLFISEQAAPRLIVDDFGTRLDAKSFWPYCEQKGAF